jgi:hypothetical protein
MNEEERIRKIKEAVKKSAETLFKPKPKEVADALEAQTVMGSPKNLVEPTDKQDD